MERGETWLVALDPSAGHEQQGKRPVLIVTPKNFNAIMAVPVVLPITSGGQFARNKGFAVMLSGPGLRTSGIVRCDQPRALDLRARKGRMLEKAPDSVVTEVLARLTPLFS